MKIKEIIKELKTVNLIPYQRVDGAGIKQSLTEEQANGYKLALEDVERLLKGDK